MTQCRASTIVEGAFVWMAFILGAVLPGVAGAQPSADPTQIPKTFNFAFLPSGVMRRNHDMDWRPKLEEWPVTLLYDFSDPDDRQQLTSLRFSFDTEARAKQPTGGYQAGWSFYAPISQQTRILPLCGYPYELTRRQRGYWFEQVQLDPSIKLPERLENRFTVSPEISFKCYYKHWEPLQPPELPKHQILELSISLIAFERIGDQSCAVLAIFPYNRIEWFRSDVNFHSETSDDPLLESPEQLLIWKNRYRARAGDVVRTKQFHYVVRRIVPPDEQGRHQGWADLEYISGLDPLPAAPPR